MDKTERGSGSEIAISIINYKTETLTRACVRSVLADAEASAVAAEVIVVDNCSDDGSAEALDAWIAELPGSPSVRLVRSATNSGYSGGHNQGIAASAASHVLILNSDAEVRPGCLRALLDAAAADQQAGILAPRLEWPDGTVQVSCFRLPGPTSELIRGAESGPLTRVLAHRVVALGTEPEAAEIGWVSFACVLVRRTMVEAIGPMDEGFFLYFEDTEYCWRAARAGWRIRHIPRARVIHHRGGSAPVKRLAAAGRRLPPYYYASRTRCMRLLHGRGGPLAANLAWTFGRALAQLRPLAGRPVPAIPERQARDIWINLSDPLGADHGPSAPGNSPAPRAAE